MTKLQMIIEFDYDAELMHGGNSDPDAIEWFFEDILMRDLLLLYSSEIEDQIGKVKIIEITSK